MALHNDSTTHKGKKLQIHNIEVSTTTVWRYVTKKGWKALKRNAATHMQTWCQKDLQTLYQRTTGQQTLVISTL